MRGQDADAARWAERAKALLPATVAHEEPDKRLPVVAEVQRPKTRGECQGGERPCPFVGCLYNLYLEVTNAGTLHLNFFELEPWEMTESCALDVADRGEATLAEIGRVLNVSRERVRQIEVGALVHLERKRVARLLGEEEIDVVGYGRRRVDAKLDIDEEPQEADGGDDGDQ